MKKIFDQIKSFPKWNWIWGTIVGVGILLRIRQYLVNRSLWVDEASLALNIVNRTFSSLLLPLDYDQGAPIGFLFIEKFLLMILGNYDYILRLFPLFSGIVAIYLFYLIANQSLGKFGILATLLFSLSGAMIYYSSEVKQYSSDVMIALLLTHLAIQCLKKESQEKDIVLLGVAGIVSIFISHPSAFVLPVIGTLLLIEKYLQKMHSQILWLLVTGISWGLAFLGTYLLSLRHLIGNENLQNYWNIYYSPLPPWEHIEWYKNVLLSLLPNITPSLFSVIFSSFPEKYLINGYLILIFVGGISLFLRIRKIAILVIFPIVLALTASAMNIYPIYDRFIFFWFPALILIIGEALKRIYLMCLRIHLDLARSVYGLLALVILWTPSITAFNNVLSPPRGEDIKPVLTYLQENVQRDDIVYVHHDSMTPFLYYIDSYNLMVDEIFVARKSRNFERFITDVENFRGSNRIWFVFSHVVSCDCEANNREGRIQAHVQILDQHGSQLDYFQATRAETYLYNLNR